jgi:hypothetical protein
VESKQRSQTEKSKADHCRQQGLGLIVFAPSNEKLCSDGFYQGEFVVLILAYLTSPILDEFASMQDCVVVRFVPGEATDQLICVS